MKTLIGKNPERCRALSPAKLGRYAVLLGALAVSCSKEEPQQKPVSQQQPALQQESHSPRFRCYGYKDRVLKLNSGDEKSPGKEIPVPFSKLEIKTDDPLDYFCTNSGHLFWVTQDTVYIRQISVENGAAKVRKIFDSSHVAPEEYGVEGVRVLSADVWENPDASWENITVATITNNGLFQAVRFSLDDFVDNSINRAIIELGTALDKRYRWPADGVKDASVRVIDGAKFVIVPLGEKQKGDVHALYRIFFSGEPGKRFLNQKLFVTTLDLLGDYPELKNVSGISKPIRYDLSRGGWIVDLVAEKKDGSQLHIFPVLAEVRPAESKK